MKIELYVVTCIFQINRKLSFAKMLISNKSHDKVHVLCVLEKVGPDKCCALL